MLACDLPVISAAQTANTKMAVDFPGEMEVVAIPVSILVFLMASTFSIHLFGTEHGKHCA